MQRVGMMWAGKWHLDELLDVGGTASVYASTHRNGSRAAIKIFERPMDWSARERVSRERHFANAVSEHGAVHVVDDAVIDGYAFLVMELLEGRSLHKLAMGCGGRLVEREVRRYIVELLRTLEAAHAQGMIHRDVKPENVFVTARGDVKLLDFGLARTTEREAVDVTLPGETVGTPAFMSPEQARAEIKLDARTDIYSVGATMFTVLTGQLVHGPCGSAFAMLDVVSNKQAPAIRSIAPHVSEPMATVVDRALLFERSYRWQTARAMREALLEVPCFT